ncbi:37S ribosomal protein S25, mitochondrial [Periconia macrospinosa]|uniref:Small ribosomal subunit protein mS23 n=1 Tax=Periconia macrospinosa TaxID=97972 RepID=A0A2V1DBP8_9PLEO|nr:37S ribosomal protein S25, mitochondrial [Periconia macrospinosa]
MGRYDFRPLRVRETAKALFDTKRNPRLPEWYKIIGDFPPTETLARPVQRAPKPVRTGKKPSRMFQPLPIRYKEDELRTDFFGDHPWELARPRIIVEDSGNDAKNYDWSKGIVQPGKQVDGESVVQRQMYLIKHERLPKAAAYDKARREFYAYRHRQDLLRRIAREEALYVGAYFGAGPLEVGMQLEDKAFEGWKSWAEKRIEDEEAMRSQLMSAPQPPSDTEAVRLAEEESVSEVEEVEEGVVQRSGEGAVQRS